MAADDGPRLGESRRRLEAIRRALQDEVVSLLEQLDTRGGQVVVLEDRLASAERIRSQVLTLMRNEGEAVLSVGEASAIEEAERVLRGRPVEGTAQVVGPVGVTTRAEALASIQRTTSGALDPITDVFGTGAQAMRKAIDIGVNTGAPLRQVISEVKTALDTTFERAQVAVDAAIRGANNAALMAQAERGGAATGEQFGYLYDGAEDSKNRDFCAEHVGKVYTKAALSRLDNGQGLPVDPFCGGYRCRHRLSPILLSDAKAEGYEVIE